MTTSSGGRGRDAGVGRPDTPAIDAPAVWLLDLDRLADRLTAPDIAARIASPDEIAWPDAAVAKVAARQRLATRIALRLLLAAAGASHPFRIPFPVTPQGKPQLGPDEPAFSVSHSGDRALIALAPDGPVGIDLEHDREVQLPAARRALMIAASEAVMTGPRPGPSEGARMLATWTCLEAIAKGRGSGIGQVLMDIGITAAGARDSSPERAASAARGLVTDSGLAVTALALPDGLYGAVALPAAKRWQAPQIRNLSLEDVLVLVG